MEQEKASERLALAEAEFVKAQAALRKAQSEFAADHIPPSSSNRRIWMAGDLATWVWQEKRVPLEIGVPAIRAWLGAVCLDVVADATRSEKWTRTEGHQNAESLQQMIRGGRATLRLAISLGVSGWTDERIEGSLGPKRSRRDVLRSVALTLDLPFETCQPVVEAISTGLRHIGQGRSFEPLGRLLHIDEGGFQVTLRRDFLQPARKGKGTFKTYEEAKVPDNEDEEILRRATRGFDLTGFAK